MTDKKVWLVTGAGRGMGVEFSKAALAAGNAVVATGRTPDAVTDAIGAADDLLVVTLDVTSRQDAKAAVQAAGEASAASTCSSITPRASRRASSRS